jgi:DNA invertase Pin-like site-specific DNA recombinase
MDEKKEEVQLRVALYLRVSTEDQVEKYGLDAQRSAIEGIIKSRGKLKDGRDAVVLAGKNYEYVDEGISGTKELDDRPAFARLKEDIQGLRTLTT